MSHWVQVEIEDNEIVDCVTSSPDLITQAIKALKGGAAVGTKDRARYDEALRLLGGEDVSEAIDPVEFAAIFARLGSMDQAACLAEMVRAVPGLRLP
jgi:hypothetical protein